MTQALFNSQGIHAFPFATFTTHHHLAVPPPQWPLYFKIQYNKQIWYDAYYVRNSKTERINFARERQAAVQPTINAASKMFAPSQTVHLVNIYLCMHTHLGGIYLLPPKHTHTNSIA